MPGRRRLSKNEQVTILRRYGRQCFIDGQPIVSDSELEFDTVVPITTGAPMSLEHLAPVCLPHCRQKGSMALAEYRDYLQLNAFFAAGSPRYLDDVIHAKGHAPGQALPYAVTPDSTGITLNFSAGAKTVSLYTCPVTSWLYFYALIPIQYLQNDRSLQPRPLRQPSLWGLYKHFQNHTQLAPSICRFDEQGTLLLFDGQHKAAAQIWAGRTAIECKVYVRPDAARIRETNLEAHQGFRQMSFYAYELTKKYADIFGENWEAYLALDGRKSESGFIKFLVNVKKMSTAKAKGEVAHAIHWRILTDPANALSSFISETNPSQRQPLTYQQVEKAIFASFLSPIPSTAGFHSAEDLRDVEERNLIRLMNLIAEEGLVGRWHPNRSDAEQQRAERLFSPGALRAWVHVLRDVLYVSLQLYLQGPEEAQRVLYRDMTEVQFAESRKYLREIFSHPLWDAPETSEQDLAKSATKALATLKKRGLVAEWVLQRVRGV